MPELIPGNAEDEHSRTVAYGLGKLWLSFVFGEKRIRVFSAFGDRVEEEIIVGGGVEAKDVAAVTISSVGEYAAIQTVGQIEVWDLASLTCNLTLQKEPGIEYCMRFSPDGRTFVTAPYNSVDSTLNGTKITFWDPVTGQQRIDQLAGNSRILAMEFLGDGSAIVVSDENGLLTAWNSTLRNALNGAHRLGHTMNGCSPFTAFGACLKSRYSLAGFSCCPIFRPIGPDGRT